jgi:putative lipoic acid-binding regulatory protein
MTVRTELLEFPCDFPLKVMGRASEEFRALVRGIVECHAGILTQDRIAERLSRDGNFMSLTFTIRAVNREQLDALYRELTSAAEVLVVL